MNTLRVLIVEDSQDDADLLVMELRRSGWEIKHQRVDTADTMAAALAAQQWDVIIADYSLPQFSGPLALAMARLKQLDVPFILVSGTVGEATAVAAMKSGADDYVFKGDLRRLMPAIERELCDLEDRRRARRTEQLLQSREIQLTEALRLARLGTWHVNFVANLTYWSDEACQLFGQAPESAEPTFQQFVASMYPDDGEALQTALKNPDLAQIALDCRLNCYQSAGVFVHIRGNIIRDEKGNPIAAGGMIQDITERKRVDAQLLSLKEAAEAANRAKSEFLANMSHELRTPMSAIIGFADMMKRPGIGAPGHDECIEVIRRNAHHLLELINEILDLSKIEAGHMTVERIQCDLPLLVTDVVELMRSRAAEKSLQFNLKLDGAIPQFVMSDALRLRQILVNLLGNAIKFTATGSIDLTVRVTGTDLSSRLEFDIRDTGIGMTNEQLHRVFEPFAQAEESTTREFGGTGLGLAISRRLARLLNGDVTVSSESGVGSLFKVTIQTDRIAGVELVSNLDDYGNRITDNDIPSEDFVIPAHILLVEDGRDNQRLISTHLKMAGATVDIAENGKLGVDCAARSKFDLILMDMQMPVMDGYTATDELRRRGVTIPIIALTAYAMSDDRSKCIASGCTDYLTKPVDRESLLALVAEHLGTQCRPDPSYVIKERLMNDTDSPPLRSSLSNYPGMAEIIVEFIAGLPAQVEELESLLKSNDTNALRRLTHQLRGSCGGYGFDVISEVAAAAEDAINAGEPPLVISTGIKSLIEIIHRVEGFDRKESRLAA